MAAIFWRGMEADGSPFDEWLATERENLRALAVECLSKLLTHQLRNSQPRAAVATARRLLTIDPSDESAHRSLMRLFCDEGRYVAARRQYQACIDALARELDVRPSEETQALYRELLGHPGHSVLPMPKTLTGARGPGPLMPETLGEFAHGRKAVTIADERHQPASSVFARLALGQVDLVRGEIEAVAAGLERASDLADEWEVRALQPQVARDLGLCRALAGATAEGVVSSSERSPKLAASGFTCRTC